MSCDIYEGKSIESHILEKMKKHIRIKLHSDIDRVVYILFNFFQCLLVFILCIQTEGKLRSFTGYVK